MNEAEFHGKSLMLRLASTLFAIFLAATPTISRADPAGDAFFEAKIRPVFVNHCYKCHSAQAKKLKGALHLDTREGLLKGGENGIVLTPGKPDESKLIQAVRYTNDDLKMPPKDQLSKETVADLEKWVAMGAPDPRGAVAAPVVAAPAKRHIDLDAGRKYWAFQPLAKGEPPAVKAGDRVRTPIDRFVFAKLEQKGLAPNGAASRTALIRRAYADLIGIPPTPAQVDAFVNDASPQAWEHVIDTLLASEHYGERWGRHWLDIVRFAESNGYEFDADRRGAFEYRDFVIRAFNGDMPYDQFIRWQIAGDKLLPGNYEAGAATGFLVAGPSPGQITAKTAEPLRYDQLDDMISTLGSSMLAVTIGCCRCHDHKFDPLPQRDYYRLISCFADTDATELKLDPKPEIYQVAEAKWKADHAPLVAEWEKFMHERLPERVQQWTREGFGVDPAPWRVLDFDRADVVVGGTPDMEKLKRLDDGSLLLENRAKRNETFTLVARTHARQITAMRIEALADKLMPKSGPGIGAKGEFLLTRFALRATPLNGNGAAVDVKLKSVRATPRAKGKKLVVGLDKNPGSGWSPAESGKDEAAIFEFDKPIDFNGGAELTLSLKFDSGIPFARPRIAIASAGASLMLEGESQPQAKGELAAMLEESNDQITAKNQAEIARWMRRIDSQTADAYVPVSKHLEKEPKEQFKNVFAAGVRGGRPVYFLGRGETNKKNGLAPPGFLEVLMTAPEQDERWTVKGQQTVSASKISAARERLLHPDAGSEVRRRAGSNVEESGSSEYLRTGVVNKFASYEVASKPTTQPVEPRVAMAKWITDTDSGAGQLLARVIVNRLWMHHMGRGIVATPNDFGVQGDAPSHLELLDWLAHDLISNGWHLKPLQKLIMTSAVYMEDGDATAANLAADPENKLFWRHPSQRLEAEAVRDSLLSVSGALQDTMYGPGTLDEASGRRSVYLTVKRSKPVLFMKVFDAPEAMQSIGERQVTTVATQALTLMNSPFVRTRAEQLALRARPKPDVDLDAAIAEAYRLAICRAPTAEETGRMHDFIERQGKTYAKNGTDTAFVDFCQALLCSDEFVYVD
ncbi:MAG TPA: PSD1 and planctomycete cytochrome C domain-containing protein [Humisphaera sp.]|nr:PSD1 and planctomycete cytochrome C domain-containing protein [Humisphaera sp.]